MKASVVEEAEGGALNADGGAFDVVADWGAGGTEGESIAEGSGGEGAGGDDTTRAAGVAVKPGGGEGARSVTGDDTVSVTAAA